MSIAHDNAHGRVPQFGMSDRLRKAREHAGLSREELVALIGIHRDSISRYETGKYVPRFPVLAAWSMATGVDLEWLKTGKAPSDDGAGPDVRPEGFEPPTYWSVGDPRFGLRMAA
jgi:transcriptional regulator with XRE-family HTH domain